MYCNCNSLATSYNIKLLNIEDEEVVTYSLLLLRGEISSALPNLCSNNKIFITIKSQNEIKIPLNDHSFKCIIELNLGKNYITLKYCSTVLNIQISYIPSVTKHTVIPLYIICKGHNGHFQAPENIDNSIESACQRIYIGVRLIQTLFAEKLSGNTINRKTFQFESELTKTFDKCVVFRSNLKESDAKQMKDIELWSHFGREIMNSDIGSHFKKYVAFISCTWYRGTKKESGLTHNDVLTLTDAHVALGGGGLALFGTACLYTWPSDVREIENAFTDDTQIDKTRFMDDSCYRGTYGGCFSTTLGAVTHELGHTFDLGHTKCGIMNRGFDNINRVFINNLKKINKNIRPTISQEVSVHLCNTLTLSSKDVTLKKIQLNDKTKHKKLNNINCNMDLTFFTKNCLALLNYHRWFNRYSSYDDAITFNYATNEITSKYDIKFLEIRHEISGLMLHWWEFKTQKKVFVIPRFCYENENNVLFIAVDSIGCIIKNKINPNI